MIRILHIVTTMNRGGIETMLMNHYRQLDRSRYQFDFIVHRPEESAYEAEILALGGRIYRFPPLKPHQLPAYLRKLTEFFNSHREYKIVHSHLDTLSTFPLQAAKKSGVPIRIAHSHNTAYPRDLKAPFRAVSKRFIDNVITERAACGMAAGEFLFGPEFKKDGTVIHNAIDLTRFSYDDCTRKRVRQALDLTDRFVIGHVGNLTYAKNHFFLLDVFAKVQAQNPRAVLLLAGTGELLAPCQEKVSQYGLTEAVHFLGSRNDVDQLLQAFDLFLFPSLYEGLPVTLVEAQATGLKCFVSSAVTRECALTDQIEYLPLTAPAERWAEKVLACANGYERHSPVEAITAAGYSVSVNTEKLQNWYGELLSRL